MASTPAAPATASGVQQPPWHAPETAYPRGVLPNGAADLELKVYNSLTRTKVPFRPQRPGHVSWYNCGPTVYDASHMGHARNYVTQDTLRRIVRDYFGYDVHFVMNITDIDDKIILRARHAHLVAQHAAQNPTLSRCLLDEVRAAWAAYAAKTIAKLAPPQAPSQEEKLEEGSLALAEAHFEEVSRLSKEPDWLAKTTEKEPKLSMWMNALVRGLQTADAQWPSVLS